jgi:hypothetical protein
MNKTIILSLLILAFLLIVIPNVKNVETNLSAGQAIRISTEIEPTTNIFLYFIAAIAMGVVVLFSIAVISQYRPPKKGDIIKPIRPRIIFDKTIIWKKS